MIAIELNGAALDESLAACLSEAELRQSLNAPSLAIVTFLDPSPETTGEIAMGVSLTLQAPDGTRLFSGEITAIRRTILGSRQASLEIRAYDRLHRLRKRQNLRQLANLSVADFASTLAGDLGISAETSGEAPPASPIVIQDSQSDFDLLAQLAERSGLVFWLDDDRLRLTSLAGDGDDAVRLTIGDNVLEVTSDVSAESMRKSSKAIGWDLADNQVRTEHTGTSAQDSLEMRLDALAAFDSLGDRVLVNRLADSADSVRRLAQADMDRATARGLSLDMLCEGSADLHPARVVQVEGVGPETDGPFVVSGAVHRFDAAAGYTTRIGTDPPPKSRPTGGAAATLGIVTSTDDPERRYRVKAKFPVLGDIESSWMPVVGVGAGASKGFSVLPEPDDQVLVLFPDGDAAHGIVIGGLYGTNSAPGERPAQGAREFVLRSPAGPQLTLDGCKGLWRFETGGGDILEVGPNGTLLRAMKDMTIEAPGRTVKIRAANVEFEKA